MYGPSFGRISSKIKPKLENVTFLVNNIHLDHSFGKNAGNFTKLINI
jgi:uncharacterized protein YozE (UPF0346 family)